MAEILATLAAEASEQAATRFVGAIEAQFELLLHFSFSGPAREQVASGLRVTFHHPYAIYYLPMLDALVIVRVSHGARDVADLAERGGFAPPASGWITRSKTFQLCPSSQRVGGHRVEIR